jgi:cyanate permease
MMGIGYAIATVAIAGLAMAPARIYFAWLLAAGLGIGMMGVGVFAFAQTLAGPEAAGKWTGLQNGFGNFAGIIGPALTGFVVDRTGNFFAPFAITLVVQVIGAIGWVLIIGKVEETAWAPEQPAAVTVVSGE